MKRALFVSMGVLALAGCASGGSSAWDFLRGHISARSAVLENWQPSDDAVARGAMQFAFGDFGGLNSDAMNTVALPWKLTSAALVLHQSPDDLSQAALRRIMQGYGFQYPETIANWPEGAGAAPRPEAAMGLVLGTGTRSIPQIELQIASTGCAACHAAPTYDAQGRPEPNRVWLGAPNPSLDLERYTQDIYRALVATSGDVDRLLAAARALYPGMTAREEKTLRDFVMPRMTDRLQYLVRAGNGPLPFHSGHAGVTNGVAALKMQHGMLAGDEGAFERERGFTSVPHLADRTFRTMLLWDGAYAPNDGRERRRMMPADAIDPAHINALAGITAYFTVPTMGMSDEAAVRAVPQVREAFAFVGTVRPQPFPGTIDMARARRGERLFAEACSSCHGSYEDSGQGPRLVRFPNTLRSVGTDPVRAETMDEALADKVNASPIRRHIRAESTGQYAPPPLTGIWQSAPYLHNGSVPSLAALLGLEERPVTFRVGGHAMDLDKVGVAYPEGYVPYSHPSEVDTRQRGMGNGGHTRMFGGLSDSEKRDLLEYLKRL
ncbi:c-type cytochrome [uncultured Brevundimonas sp.]|uniref:c-type cytochrome n=1 Tax=uncultured Brevundimonas sp. TaxID=213418 RepID=UPI0026376801|nr:c-type cytochrome [uncultured Brevundimonas sp.]